MTQLLTSGDAAAIDNSSPAMQNAQVGTKLKYALDQLGGTDTDGINIDATCTSGVAIAGTQTNGVLITATATNGVSMTGTITNGLVLGGTMTTGITLSGNKTTGMTIGGTNTNSIAFTGKKTHALDFSGMSVDTNTDGSIVSTGAAWIAHATAGACAFKLLCSSTATSGDYATLRIRARSDAANPTGGIVGGNFSASANINDYGNLYAVQGYAQPLTFTQAGAANIICGVYSCVDRTVATSGRSWSLWTDTHETIKASAGHYLHRLSHNGGAINLDGIWSIYAGQGCDYLMNFENTNAPVSAGDKTGGTKTYALKVYIDGAARYIQLYD